MELSEIKAEGVKIDARRAKSRLVTFLDVLFLLVKKTTGREEHSLYLKERHSYNSLLSFFYPGKFFHLPNTVVFPVATLN